MRGPSGIVRQRVIACHMNNPGFTAWQIAQETKCDSGYVRRVLGWRRPIRSVTGRPYEAMTPSLPPDAKPLPHSADDIWTERKTAEACDRLLDRLEQVHGVRA